MVKIIPWWKFQSPPGHLVWMYDSTCCIWILIRDILGIFTNWVHILRWFSLETPEFSAVDFSCHESSVTATVDPDKLNMTITSISLEDCTRSNYTVTGNTVTADFDDCAHNVTQSDNTIVQVGTKPRSTYLWTISYIDCLISSFLVKIC